MRTITARHRGVCAGCGGDIRPGQTITGQDGDWYHGPGGGQGCAPSGNPGGDAEYLSGAREANEYMANRALYGDEAADAIDIEAMLRDPEGW